MIKEERLKELIEKEATIYVICKRRSDVYEKDAKFIKCIDKTKNGDCVLEWQDNKSPIIEFISLERIFETKSEAEFYAKYGNVEKTVKMPVPPTWEEFLENEISFNVLNCELFIYSENKNIKFRHWYKNDFDIVLVLQNTEENYYKALDKMVELWREEV